MIPRRIHLASPTRRFWTVCGTSTTGTITSTTGTITGWGNVTTDFLTATCSKCLELAGSDSEYEESWQ